MAKSNSQKKIAHLIRQGKIDPRELRGNWNGVKPITKVVPKKNRYKEELE